ncbi:MAG: beta-aspartyl-peptidase [Bacillota bacterium]|nr:beta-aspartyl-peptidase [Bacillota bacterium]
MFKLLKGGHCYTPGDIGIKDVAVVYGHIYRVDENISRNILPDMEVLDCSGKIICPAFIDQHVHITGGGGEEGPVSRIPEISLGEILSSGVATVVGVLGVDGITRSVESLLAKARGLEAEGLNTYIYTGSYSVPTATITGKVISDMVLIDKVIGAGEIAIADHRSSNPSIEQLAELASQVHTGGLLGGKAGILHLHVGDGKEGIEKLFRLVYEYDFPVEMFVPTHLNRNTNLFEQAAEYLKIGGTADFTAGETSGKGCSVPEALSCLTRKGINLDKVTVSSDGNGSIPAKDGQKTGIGRVRQLYDDICSSIISEKINPEDAFKTVTENVARILKIYPRKGTLTVGSDADILVLNSSDLSIDKFLIGGDKYIDNGNIMRKGRYEK